MSFALERFKKSSIEQRERSRFRLLIQQKLLGVFLEIKKFHVVHGHACYYASESFVDTPIASDVYRFGDGLNAHTRTSNPQMSCAAYGPAIM